MSQNPCPSLIREIEKIPLPQERIEQKRLHDAHVRGVGKGFVIGTALATLGAILAVCAQRG